MKFLALYAGLAGVAIFGQLMNVSTILITFGLAGIGTGVTKHIASSVDLKARLIVIGTSLRIILVSSITVGAILFLFSGEISSILFDTSSYGLVFKVFGASIIFACLNNWLLAVINGFKEYRLFTYSNLASSLLISLLTAAFVFLWGSEGALIAFVLGQSVVVVITVALSEKSWFRYSLLKASFSVEVARRLVGYSLVTLAGTILLPFSQIVVRSVIVDRLSISDAGIWEGMTRISFVYLSVLTASIQIYYLPRLAEITTTPELIGEIKKTYRLVIPPLIIIGVIVFVLRDFVIYVLFTPEFVRMRELFAWQLIGDFLKIASWLLAFVMPARGLIKPLLLTEIIFNATYVLFSVGLLYLYGLAGVPIGYALNYLLYFIAVFLIVRKHVNSK